MVVEKAQYIISVAARIVEMHPQTLRKYERAGFLEPSRSEGNLRLYSTDDLDRLFQIKSLVDERGINLAGVELALRLTRRLHELDEALDRLDGLAAEHRDTSRALIRAMLEELGIPNQTHGGANGQSHWH
ncbi:MAG: MerR family transcriptional regulator [Dehalococcoidia bacterium]